MLRHLIAIICSPVGVWLCFHKRSDNKAVHQIKSSWQRQIFRASLCIYRQTSNISRTLVGKNIDYSDVVGASPVGGVLDYSALPSVDFTLLPGHMKHVEYNTMISNINIILSGLLSVSLSLLLIFNDEQCTVLRLHIFVLLYVFETHRWAKMIVY